MRSMAGVRAKALAIVPERCISRCHRASDQVHWYPLMDPDEGRTNATSPGLLRNACRCLPTTLCTCGETKSNADIVLGEINSGHLSPHASGSFQIPGDEYVPNLFGCNRDIELPPTS